MVEVSSVQVLFYVIDNYKSINTVNIVSQTIAKKNLIENIFGETMIFGNLFVSLLQFTFHIQF